MAKARRELTEGRYVHTDRRPIAIPTPQEKQPACARPRPARPDTGLIVNRPSAGPAEANGNWR